MKKLIRTVLVSIAMATSLPACAHEFWMASAPFSPALSGTSLLTLNVGQNLDGELIGFSSTHVAALRRYSMNGMDDLRRDVLTPAVVGGVNIKFKAAGTYVVAMDSIANFVTLSSDKFHAYLHDEGLDHIIKQREDAGTDATPGRERYYRNVKTILRVGGKSDATYAVRTAQRLEIVPLQNLLEKQKGSTLRFGIFFDNKPLPEALVKAWHQHDDQVVIIKSRTTSEGKVAFTLPFSGPWMISVVNMIAAVDSPDVDWDSYWGNLTFEMTADKR